MFRHEFMLKSDRLRSIMSYFITIVKLSDFTVKNILPYVKSAGTLLKRPFSLPMKTYLLRDAFSVFVAESYYELVNTNDHRKNAASYH